MRFICILVAVVLVGTLHLLASLSGQVGIILIVAALSCLLPYGLWSLLELEIQTSDVYVPGLATITGVLLGGIVGWMGGLSQALWIDVLAVGLSAVGSGIVIVLRLREYRAHCELCHQPFTGLQHPCPRCSQQVCGETSCWVEAYARCTDCETYQVPLFPSHEDWWQERLGPCIDDGLCVRCHRDATVCNLRQCGQCPWAMCTQCWDLENGCCIRCDWRIPHLSESLRLG